MRLNHWKITSFRGFPSTTMLSVNTTFARSAPSRRAMFISKQCTLLRATAPARGMRIMSPIIVPTTPRLKVPMPPMTVKTFSVSAFSMVDMKSKLPKNPEVSTTSSVVDVISERSEGAVKDPVVMNALTADIKAIRESFSLSDVPPSVVTFGLLGVTPYVLTSAATLFLAWDINFAHAHNYTFFFQPETAEMLLHFLEPLQIGYGAVILSFLGAIHWGLEFAQFGGTLGYRRYAIGILAPLLAWPTVLLPFDYALLVQFLGFTGIYSADVTASKWGWAPSWYPTYRFLLTFIVGASIVVTLIGRGKVGDKISGVMRPADHVVQLRKIQGEELAKEEDFKAHKQDELAQAKENEEQESEDNDDEGTSTDKEAPKEGDKKN